MSKQEAFNPFKFDLQVGNEKILELKKAWEEYAGVEQWFSGQQVGEGKGIVITSGGIKYFTSAWVLIKMLKEQGCNLPIEVWFFGEEMTKAMKRQLKNIGVKCCDMQRFMPVRPHGFLMKPLSIVYSSFKEVLFLDADNVCVRDPAYLFEDKNYLECGAVFWPDYWKTSSNNPIWSILALKYIDGYEQDSGQLLIDKSKCWNQLQLCIYFNIHGHDYYKFLYGDKDTFRFAWLALHKSFYMIPHLVGSCGYQDTEGNFYGHTMVQYDPSGAVIFLHRNLLKWDVTQENERLWIYIRRFLKSTKDMNCILKGSYLNHNAISLEGDTEQIVFDEVFPDFEVKCLAVLKKLRASKFYNKELLAYYLSKNRFSVAQR